jgi:hypothetical protein
MAHRNVFTGCFQLCCKTAIQHDRPRLPKEGLERGAKHHVAQDGSQQGQAKQGDKLRTQRTTRTTDEEVNTTVKRRKQNTFRDTDFKSQREELSSLTTTRKIVDPDSQRGEFCVCQRLVREFRVAQGRKRNSTRGVQSPRVQLYRVERRGARSGRLRAATRRLTPPRALDV